MNLNQKLFDHKKKSSLKVNKVLIIIVSVLLVTCVSALVYFLFKTGNTKNNQGGTHSSESSISEKTNHTEENVDDSDNEKSSDELSDANNVDLKNDYSLWNSNCKQEEVLVNANNKLPDDYKVKLGDYCGVSINAIISEPLENMVRDAREKANVTLYLSSCYRSIETQTELFNQGVKKRQALGNTTEEAEKLTAMEIARPGYSEHNTGLAVDLNGVKDDFPKTKEYKWLIENSYKYGFILRYPEEKKDVTGIVYEPWHFRFVGVDVATEMKEKNLCYEEYVASKQ